MTDKIASIWVIALTLSMIGLVYFFHVGSEAAYLTVMFPMLLIITIHSYKILKILEKDNKK